MLRSDLKKRIFMNMARELSALGTCCRMKVGCLLLRYDGSIASGGFNGALPGLPHCNEDTCNDKQRCLHTSHAEENAISFCTGDIATAFVTHEPCLNCTRMLVRRGCRKIYYEKPYTSMSPNEKYERGLILGYYKVELECLPCSETSL